MSTTNATSTCPLAPSDPRLLRTTWDEQRASCRSVEEWSPEDLDARDSRCARPTYASARR